MKREDDMGADRKSNMFVVAVRTLSSMSEEKREQKLKLFRKSGFSEDDILSTFKRAPQVFALSERKINEITEIFLTRKNVESALSSSRISRWQLPTRLSFNIILNARVSVKNTNFGHFKFDNTTISFNYGGVGVGDAFFARGRSKARSTKKMNVTVELNSNNIPNNSSLQSEIESGFLALTCHSKLSGKVQLMKLIKKKKSAEMNCAMLVNLVTKAVQDIKCQ
ncbi:putative Late embryoproteinsis abundant hydroxyproline-rich glycofamily protein [Hibiscus syriacus]|uniref:Late embryoproteinsis abundant hydroxyproline-rich glycofamily protein n=1 Tax=Hibiscus syriacus TaxID=106335 RepID=A0A6A2ZFS4_HIBSY|nr:putative Late embryoproteinsis abundant hydroxyproline-rich glycofamily protein [Hibiscus syriacus]